MKARTLRFFSAVIALSAVLPALCSCSPRKYNLPKETLSITRADGGALTVEAELAVRPEERNWGYMGRKNIPQGTGMLFVFEQDQILRFWMKDTPHPLSIAYIDSAGIIRDIFDMTPFSLADVTSSRSVRYALEVPRGWFAANGIKPGDTVLRGDGSPLRNLLRPGN